MAGIAGGLTVKIATDFNDQFLVGVSLIIFTIGAIACLTIWILTAIKRQNQSNAL